MKTRAQYVSDARLEAMCLRANGVLSIVRIQEAIGNAAYEAAAEVAADENDAGSEVFAQMRSEYDTLAQRAKQLVGALQSMAIEINEMQYVRQAIA